MIRSKSNELLTSHSRQHIHKGVFCNGNQGRFVYQFVWHSKNENLFAENAYHNEIISLWI